MAYVKNSFTIIALCAVLLSSQEVKSKKSNKQHWEEFNIVSSNFNVSNTSEIKEKTGYNKNISGKFTALLPFLIKRKFICLAGANYEIEILKLNNLALYDTPEKGDITPTENMENNYHRIYFLTGFSWIFSKQLNLYAETDVGVSSTMKYISAKDINFQSLTYFLYTFEETGTEVIGGIALNYDFGQPVLLPVLGLHRTLGKSATVDVLMPIQISFKFKINPHIGTGVKFKAVSREYRMNNEIFVKHESISLKKYRLYPFIDYNIGQGFFLRITGGMSTEEILIRREDYNTIAKLKQKTGYFGEISFRIAI